jgi:type II secretory pathway component PulM
VTRRVIVYDRRRPCPLCGRRRSSLLVEVLAFMWREIPPRGRLLVLALWLFVVAQTAPRGLWPSVRVPLASSGRWR